MAVALRLSVEYGYSDLWKKSHLGKDDDVEQDSYPFCHLLRLLPPELRMTILSASKAWPEPLQLRLWRAVRQREGARWKTPSYLRAVLLSILLFYSGL